MKHLAIAASTLLIPLLLAGCFVTPHVITFPDGTAYRGQAVNGLPEGEGVITFANGNAYNGQVHNGQMHGQGRLSYADGTSFYEGDFKDGQRHGNDVVRLSRFPDAVAAHPERFGIRDSERDEAVQQEHFKPQSLIEITVGTLLRLANITKKLICLMTRAPKGYSIGRLSIGQRAQPQGFHPCRIRLFMVMPTTRTFLSVVTRSKAGPEFSSTRLASRRTSSLDSLRRLPWATINSAFIVLSS